MKQLGVPGSAARIFTLERSLLAMMSTVPYPQRFRRTRQNELKPNQANTKVKIIATSTRLLLVSPER